MIKQLWSDQLRPQTVAECILPDRIKNKFTEMVSAGDFTHLLLCGTSGTGKTTIAKALCSELGYDVLFINGSNEGRLLDTLRTKVEQFATSMSFFGKSKCVIVDEACGMPVDTQKALKSFIEANSGNCRFIFTANYKNKIDDAILSRCTNIDFDLSAEEIKKCATQYAGIIVKFLKSNDIDFEKSVLAEVIRTHMPDWRRCSNELQSSLKDGKISSYGSQTQTDIDNILDMIKERKFNDARVWVYSNPVRLGDLAELIDKNITGKVTPKSHASVVPVFADYDYKSSHVSNPKLNILAMLVELMQTLEWN